MLNGGMGETLSWKSSKYSNILQDLSPVTSKEAAFTHLLSVIADIVGLIYVGYNWKWISLWFFSSQATTLFLMLHNIDPIPVFA